MKKLRGSFVCGFALLMMVSMAVVVVPRAQAYANTSKPMWQIAISGNCNNPALCPPTSDNPTGTGGFWGWVEFDIIGGDATLVGCSHVVGGGATFMNGAQFFSADIASWRIVVGTMGPEFFVTGTETFKGGSLNGATISFTNMPTGIPAAPGHYSSQMLFGFPAPPGTNFELQVVQLPR